MNRDAIEGDQPQRKGKPKEKWRALTGDHVDKIAGQRNQRSDEIQARWRACFCAPPQ
jgi:uncharacterized protein YjbJ (UPF0337 family)